MMSDWHDGRCWVDLGDRWALCIHTRRERAGSLLHVKWCRWSNWELDTLSIVGNYLLELAPHLEPPVGFEVRLLERFGGTEPGH
jgi:hypothetical protein